jgi:hypothetical protein
MKPTTFILIAATALSAGGALAQESNPGETSYQQYCATCHGMSGTGNGPMGEILTVPVPDLTQLSAANDGKFPMLDVIHIIDGRTGLRGHGGPMPVYGAVFDDEADPAGPYGVPVVTRGRILSLAYYLESMQE